MERNICSFTDSTLVIILGASDFKFAPSFTTSHAFRNSATRFINYVRNYLEVPDDHLLNLFGSTDPVTSLNSRIKDFLETNIGDSDPENRSITDVILYYVGHGGFSEDDMSAYYLAIAGTQEDSKYQTSYSISWLAKTLKKHAAFVRRYIILDSCFSAAAYSFFQSGPVEVARQQLTAQFPARGTAMLCASGPRNPAKILPSQKFTMFSEILMETLESGIPGNEENISLGDIGKFVEEELLKKYSDGVRPQLMAPDQQQGNISTIPLFPNFSRTQLPDRLYRRRIEGEIAQLRKALAEERSANESRLATDNNLRSIAKEIYDARSLEIGNYQRLERQVREIERQFSSLANENQQSSRTFSMIIDEKFSEISSKNEKEISSVSDFIFKAKQEQKDLKDDLLTQLSQWKRHASEIEDQRKVENNLLADSVNKLRNDLADIKNHYEKEFSITSGKLLKKINSLENEKLSTQATVEVVEQAAKLSGSIVSGAENLPSQYFSRLDLTIEQQEAVIRSFNKYSHWDSVPDVVFFELLKYRTYRRNGKYYIGISILFCLTYLSPLTFNIIPLYNEPVNVLMFVYIVYLFCVLFLNISGVYGRLIVDKFEFIDEEGNIETLSINKKFRMVSRVIGTAILTNDLIICIVFLLISVIFKNAYPEGQYIDIYKGLNKLRL